jgi:hypothetical protein
MRSTTSADRAAGKVLGRRGAGLQRGLALCLVAGLELVDQGAVHAIAGGDLSGALVVDEPRYQEHDRLITVR